MIGNTKFNIVGDSLLPHMNLLTMYIQYQVN